MATGPPFMTEKENNEISNDFKKLSIQVGLNGLSFCAVDTISNQVLTSQRIPFKIASTPYLLLKELQSALDKNNLSDDIFEVVVVHKNKLFSLVPKPFFNKKDLASYLKFNAKIMANDHIAFDELENHDLVNVYVPFTNVNNYVFDLFGEFDFKHSGSVLISTLLSQNRSSSNTFCYVLVSEKEMEIVMISKKKLLFYNYFEYKNKEDFLYYLLFSLEQLDLDNKLIQLKLFGNIEEGDDVHKLCRRYIKNVSVSIPSSNTPSLPGQFENAGIDFTVLNTLR